MTTRVSINILLGLLSTVVLFHFLVIAKMIPYEIAWGGRLKNDSEMYVFETFSILINVSLGFLLLMKGNYVKFQFKEKALDIALWIFFALFILNTVGNLFAKTILEKSFAALTFIFAILIWKILKTKCNASAT